LHRGQIDKVREHAKRGAELAAEAGDRPYVISFEALLASLDLALGEYGSAAARYRPLVSQGRQLGLRLFVSQGIAADAVEAFALAGSTDEAEALLAEVTPLARDVAAAAAMARCRGAIAAARQDLAGARAELLAAIGSDDLPPLDRGRALLLLGAVQRRQKQRAEARATLTKAMTIFTDIDAPLWRARASDELSRIGGRPPGPEDLTETERRVADLVARGLSNREVAAALFVTVRAVESTLTKTYAKLGVRSRTELASRIRSG
jgi:DNA-binding CsgD family transcriptional regulator